MKRKFLPLLGLSLLVAATMSAQVVTIQQIQTVSATDLGNCVDSSSLKGKTVTVRGVVVTSGNLSRQTSTGCTALNSRNIWIQNGTGAFSGLDIFGSCSAATSIDLRDLLAGDSVEITGKVEEFQGESEIIPSTGSGVVSVKTLASNRPVRINKINLSDLNDNLKQNKLPTGEKWEGTFVQVDNLTVVSVDPFSSNSRVSFYVSDASGNLMNVSDRFVVQKLPAGGGTFTAPNVGDKLSYVRGIILHSRNGCTGSTGRGYEIHPFDTSHYRFESAAPSITLPIRNLIAPTATNTVNVSSTVTSARGIKKVSLFYAIGVGNNTYQEVAMTAVGNLFTGTIPAQADGSFVKYYVSAEDNTAPTRISSNPAVPTGVSNPLFYRVRAAGLQIFDVQYTPYTNGNSGYLDMEVTVTGTVIASAEADNLGFVFIQQEGTSGWGGLQVTQNATLSTLKINDKVTVTGTVKENFGVTTLTNVSTVNKIGTGSINAIKLSPSVFTKYDFAGNEQYENMLITLANDTGKVRVVRKNADLTGNNAEYRVGVDINDPNAGTRVIAGRVSGTSAYSSLNVSYVNDSIWATRDGIMKVNPIVVKVGTFMDSVKGVMFFSFSNFKLMPRNNKDFFKISIEKIDTLSILTATIPGASVNLYPNPVTSGHINLEVEGFVLKANTTISVTDMSGRMVRTYTIPAYTTNYRIDVDMPAGIYTVTMTNATQGFISRGKFVVSK